MGILGALSTAVSGLSAQSYALENISGNIANSSTVGFKRVDTSFVDLIPERPARQEVAGSVAANSQLTNSLQGQLASTSVPTNMALSGKGFFVVAENTGSTGSPAFAGSPLYTRRGDFKSDASGYLVNGSGHYLSGTNYNPVNGAVTSSTNSPIKLSTTAIPAKLTSIINYSGNLPSTPKPKSFDATVPGSDRLDPTDFTVDPTTGKVETITGAQTSTFLSQTIPGGDIVAYNSLGTAANVQLQWAKISSDANGSNWQLFYQSDADATGGATSWKNVGTVTFNASGVMTGAPTGITGLSANGVSVGDVALSFGSGGLTQYGDPSGVANVSADQDGYTSGSLSKVAIGSDGTVVGSYSNGQTAKLAQVTVAQFANPDGLKREDGGAYAATAESGSPSYGLGGTSLAGGSLEQSNTDISDEFSKMIVTQQAYSANTRVMSTAQQMLQDVINVIR